MISQRPRIYLDHAATTPVHSDVEAAMRPFLFERFGNATSTHSFGREARVAMDEARMQLAKRIGANFDEIVCTSGGTESDNFAIIGTALKMQERGRHIVTTSIEHHGVLHPCQFLSTLGFEVTAVPVDSSGVVDPKDIERALRNDTVLVSVMWANNEIGTIQPIIEISEIAQSRNVPFHTDAVQATGSIPVNVSKSGIDLLSLSAHKMYGPKGAGALYIRRGVPMVPWLYGGGQERGRRSGTENVAGIVGLSAAMSLAQSKIVETTSRICELRNRLETDILQNVDGSVVNGGKADRLPGHSNIRFEGIAGDALLMNLDLMGIAVSTGSACTSGALDASHVLLAIGLYDEEAKASVRFTLGRGTTEDEISIVTGAVAEAVARLRKSRRTPAGR